MKNKNVLEKFQFKKVVRDRNGIVTHCVPKSKADFLVGYSCRKCIFNKFYMVKCIQKYT